MTDREVLELIVKINHEGELEADKTEGAEAIIIMARVLDHIISIVSTQLEGE